MKAVRKFAKVVSLLSLLLTSFCSLRVYAMMEGSHHPEEKGVRTVKQARLDEFRRDQLELREYKKEARGARLETKVERLRGALAEARDHVDFMMLSAMSSQSCSSETVSRPSTRKGLFGAFCLCLMALDSNSRCEAVDISSVIPPGRVEVNVEPRSQTETFSTTGTASGAGPSSAEMGAMAQLPEVLTNILMQQIALDEVDQSSAMVQRALSAQRSMLQSSLGAAVSIARTPPAPSPGAQLIQNAFTTALSETARDSMNDILPAHFGPVPNRRGTDNSGETFGSNGIPVCEELKQAKENLTLAKKGVVTAIREAKAIGSDIVVAATSLLAYGAYSSVGYGLSMGASISSIFTSNPPSAAGVASGTLFATANGFFLAAYASDAVAGAVMIHKLKEPYIDALIKVADAEKAWVDAYNKYEDVRRQAGDSCPLRKTSGSSDTASNLGSSSGSPSSTQQNTTDTGAAAQRSGGTPTVESTATMPTATMQNAQRDPSPDSGTSSASNAAESYPQPSGAVRGATPFWP